MNQKIFLEPLLRISNNYYNTRDVCEICGEINHGDNPKWQNHVDYQHKDLHYFVCWVCANLYVDMDKFIMHLKKHKLFLFVCHFCKSKFSEYNEYMEHTVNQHKIYMCCVCRFSSNDSSEIIGHVSDHKENYIFLCPSIDCNVQSGFKSYINLHMREKHEYAGVPLPSNS